MVLSSKSCRKQSRNYRERKKIAHKRVYFQNHSLDWHQNQWIWNSHQNKYFV
jgi:hypothetical protein